MADFEFYKLIYKGSVIPNEDTFESAVVMAKAYVDGLIGDKSNMVYDFVQEAYNKAICCAAEEIYKEDTEDNGEKKVSESVGNHSITYSSTAKSSTERNKTKYDKVRLFLVDTGLLYRGLG